MSEDKTLAPTPRRRQQARAAGRVAQSRDLSCALLLLGSLGLLAMTGGQLVEFLGDLLKAQLSGGAWRAWIDAGATGGAVAEQWNTLVPLLSRLFLPVLAGAAVVGLSAGFVQRGFLVRPVRAEFSRLNPLTGLRRVASGGLARLVFGVVKVGVVAGVGLAGLWSRREAVAGLSASDARRLATEVWDICLGATLEMAAALLVLGAVDYLYERFKLERELRMTPQELREELRELAPHRQLADRRGHLRQASGNRASADAAPPV